MNDFVPSIPDTLGDRLRWLGGSFHASAELKGSPEFDDLLARYAEQMGAAHRSLQMVLPQRIRAELQYPFQQRRS